METLFRGPRISWTPFSVKLPSFVSPFSVDPVFVAPIFRGPRLWWIPSFVDQVVRGHRFSWTAFSVDPANVIVTKNWVHGKYDLPMQVMLSHVREKYKNYKRNNDPESHSEELRSIYALLATAPIPVEEVRRDESLKDVAQADPKETPSPFFKYGLDGIQYLFQCQEQFPGDPE